MRQQRAWWLVLGLLGCLAVAGQEVENPQTPREFARATARLVKRFPEVCTHQVVWTIVFDMSRSGMGRWSDWAKQVVGDLIAYVMAEGDELVLIPFDVAVNPARGQHPGGRPFRRWAITEAGKPTVQAEVAPLIHWRQNSPDGTAWVEAARAGLEATAAVPRTSPDKLGLLLLISDRDSSDLKTGERSQLDAIGGLRPRGQSLWPLPRDVKPIVVFYTASAAAPTGPAVNPTRWLPPLDPPAPGAPATTTTTTTPLTLPSTSRPAGRPGWVWPLAALLTAGGLWLLFGGLAARRQVEVRWGFREHNPAGQVTVGLAIGQHRLLTASAEPSADPFCVFADGADNPVTRKAVLEGLGRLVATPDGVRLEAGEQYLVREFGTDEWGEVVNFPRAGGRRFVEFRLTAQNWLLTRQPVGCEVTVTGHDWRQKVAVGGLCLVVALLVLALVKPRTVRTKPLPLPGPTTTVTTPARPGQPTERLCGG